MIIRIRNQQNAKLTDEVKLSTVDEKKKKNKVFYMSMIIAKQINKQTKRGEPIYTGKAGDRWMELYKETALQLSDG